jgi:hypothetical protein
MRGTKMQLGMITSYDTLTLSGTVTTVGGEELKFSYADGQNMRFSKSQSTPTFSGTHEQPGKYFLKHPDVGDAVAFSLNDEGGIATWGYVRHYLEAAERHYPTRFAVTA